MGVRILATRGTESQIQSVSSASQSEGQIAYATDTKDFYVSDGTQFNKIGKDQLSQFSEISIVTDVNTWTINQDNGLDLNPPESNPTGITFKPDGTKVFTIGYSLNRVQMYDLSTAWDLTSAGSPTQSEYLVQNNLSSVQEDFFIDSSGTRMYVLSRNSDSIGQFTLNTAWDISDITFVQDLHINSTSLSGNVTGIVTGEPDPAGLTFKPDGTILYLVGYNQDKVHQIPLSTAWDISTHGTITELSLSPANSSQAIQFSSDGTDMYIGDYSTESIVHFTLSTAWDVTTATLVSKGVPFLENFGLPTSTGFYFNDVAGKAFICGRSGDYAYEVIITDAIKFTNPVSTPMLYGDTIHAGNIITSNTGLNYFYNPLFARSTFYSLTTTYLGDSSPTPSIRFGNTVYGGGQVVVHRNLYTSNNGGSVPEFRIMQPRVGGRGIIKIGKEYETTAYLEGGVIDIESEASTFDHLGEFTLGGELKVGGTKPLAYKDPNLYTSGTQIVLDNFNETADTDITSHTPDTGSGYTQVYASNGVTDDDIPFIPANGGYLKAERSNSNDGRRYVNDTTISTNNYEVRAVIKQQVNSDDPFSIVVKYIDEDNYFIMHFAANYSYCYPYSVINGVYTQYGALYYYANTSTADNLGLEVAVRVVGNQVSVFYEGEYRGSKEINITGAGKAGFGFGRTSDLYGISFDLHTNISISKFEVYELPDSLFDGSDSVHYIENGKLGIGTTSPSTALHVISKSSGDGITISTSQDISVAKLYNTNSESFPVGALSLQYGSNNAGLISGQSNRLNIRGGGSSGGSISFASHTIEMMRLTSTGLGIGTTSPSAKTHIVGDSTSSADTSLLVENSTGGDLLKVDNNGTITVQPYRQIQTSSSGANAITIQTATHQQFKAWTNAFRWFTQNGAIMELTNDGKLGIGTTSPVGILHAYSTSAPVIESPSNAAMIIRRNDNAGYSSLLKYHSGNSEKFVAGLSDSGDFTGSTGEEYIIGTTKTNPLVVLKNDGKLGIGTTSPLQSLHVNGNIQQQGTTNSIYMIDGGEIRGTSNVTLRSLGTFIALQSSGSLFFQAADTERMRIDATTGNVGIGTTSPTTALQVVGRTKTSELHASNGNAIYTNQGKVAIGTSQVDATAVLNVVGDVKASGTIKGKMEQMFACSFADDLGTTKHYLPFTSNAEQTNVHADQAAMVMPYNGRVKSIQMRLSNIDADTIRTFGIETIATGINMYASSNNWTIEETESYELAATDDFYLVNYVFSNTNHFESGDLLAISIQDAEDAYTASRQTYVNVIIEYDLNNGMGNDTSTTKYTS